MPAITNLIKLKKDFIDEDQTKYIRSETERKEYLVSINDEGECFDAQGELITSKQLLYVLDANYNLYGVPVEKKWNHSFLVAGEPVKAAGIIEIDKKGRLDLVSNESGHYCPTLLDMMHALKYFVDKMSKHSSLENVLFSNHEDAQRKKLITSYKLMDLVNSFDYKSHTFEEDLNELWSEVEFKKDNKNTTQTPVGYSDTEEFGTDESATDESSNEETFFAESLPSTKKSSTTKFFSRFGLNPDNKLNVEPLPPENNSIRLA